MRTLTILLAALALAAPQAVAIPGFSAEPGLRQACDSSDNQNPCRWIIPDTDVVTGESRTYRGAYVAVGTVIVHTGGEVHVVDSSIKFEDTSGGFVVEPGGILTFSNTALFESQTTLSDYRIVAQPASSFSLTTTSVDGGLGVVVQTEDATVAGNTLRSIPLALLLEGVRITVDNNTFVDNTVAVNQTGGGPTLTGNTFVGGDYCVRDWRTNPQIVGNVFLGCRVGIWHEQSESLITDNTMEDHALPPGAGIAVVDTESPLIQGNTIRRYGTGILIVNARGFVRDNVIEDNLGDGVHVWRNGLAMDITDNLIRWNGGDGIHLRETLDVPVSGNTIEDNGGDGIHVAGSPAASVSGNLVRRNGGHGILIEASAAASLADNLVEDNALDGIHVDAASIDALIERAQALGNGGDGIALRGSGARVVDGLAQGNDVNGLEVQGASDVRIEGIAADGNGLDGVFLGASTTTLVRVNASDNARNGFTYDPMGPLNVLGETELNLVRALGNGGAGLHNIRGNLTRAADAWFQGNARAGVDNDDPVGFIDARNAYWGNATGPRTTLNPAGTGDRVEGNVFFVPFRQTPP